MNQAAKASSHWLIMLSLLVAMLLEILPLAPGLQSWRPQWTALLVIYWCMAEPQRFGVGLGWLSGLLLDLMTGSLFGLHALGLSVVAYLSANLYLRIRLFPLWQQSIFLFGFLLADRLLKLWVIGFTNQPTPPLDFWLAPLIGTLCWPLLVRGLNWIGRRRPLA